jgi:hypothetical protein
VTTTSRDASHDVKRTEKAADDLDAVMASAETVELPEHTADCCLGTGQGPLGVRLSLQQQEFAMLQELFSIEI